MFSLTDLLTQCPSLLCVRDLEGDSLLKSGLKGPLGPLEVGDMLFEAVLCPCCCSGLFLCCCHLLHLLLVGVYFLCVVVGSPLSQGPGLTPTLGTGAPGTGTTGR